MTTQDFIKGIDITGLTSVTGSELDQLIEVGRLTDDKGLILVTTDTALGVPDVPNPNAPDGQDITPIWWKRYKWVRLPYNNDGKAKEYVWNDKLTVSDATYLKWYYQNTDAEQALADAATANNTATDALTNSQDALVQSQNAQDAATQATTLIQTLQDDLVNLTNLFNTLKASLNTTWPSGSIRVGANYEQGRTGYSRTVDQGWLYCDGTAVSRIVFAGLYAAIGTKYGPGDGETTFNIPDMRGRTIVGDNPLGANGLTLRNVAQTFGQESTALTINNLPDHNHWASYQFTKFDGDAGGDDGCLALGVSPDGSVQVIKTQDIADAGNAAVIAPGDLGQAFDNFQPSIAMEYFIKT